MSQIVDIHGRPIQMAALREPQTARVGWLQREWDEHPARGITPARLQSIMQRAETGDLVAQLELADDMEERDAHLYAELAKRRGAITALDWSIEPPDKADAAEKSLTDRVRDWVDMLAAHASGVDGGVELVLQTMTDAMLKGFAPQEMVWRYEPDGSGRKVQVPRLTAQPQRWFTLTADRRRFLLRSREMIAATDELPAVAGQELEPFAWLMHVHPARNGYLARMSLARVLFWPYLFKNFSVRDLAEFLEIYGIPPRIGSYPAGSTDEEKLRLLQAVTQIGHNAAGVKPTGMTIDFMEAAKGTEVPFVAMWDRMDAAESKAILGQTLTASEGQHGTQALGNVHNEVRMDIRAADARLIEGSFLRQLIHPLVAVNEPGANPRRLPRLVLDIGEAEDMQLYAENLPKLAAQGMKIGIRWAQEKLRIPEPSDGEPVMGSADAAPGDTPEPVPPGQPPGAAIGPAAVDPKTKDDPARAALAGAAAAPPEGAARDAIDDLVDEQAAQWQPLLAPLVAPLLAELDKAVAAGESIEAFAARLPQLVQLMDAQPLTERLAFSAFSARLAGEAGMDLAR